MNAVLQSFLLVFAGEFGDKTQILALLLAARTRKPWSVMGGILVATLLNHGLASWLGVRVAAWIPAGVLPWCLALIFFAFAAWILVPDRADDPKMVSGNAWVATVVSFFLAEMGDKTQLATVALGARFHDPLRVTLGTTLGMLAADGLAVGLGSRLTERLPMAWVRRVASALFALIGLLILLKLRP